jgi:hypothetical protein
LFGLALQRKQETVIQIEKYLLSLEIGEKKHDLNFKFIVEYT